MGTSPAKPKSSSPDAQKIYVPVNTQKWNQLKERKIDLEEMMVLSEKSGQSLESIEKAISYLDQKRIVVEKGILGVGGSGFVLKACSEENDSLAVKFMKYKNMNQFESNKREYQILKKFNSPYVTKVFDCFYETYDSMEYQIIVMERYDLKYYITKKINSCKNLNHTQYYSMCYQLARGLSEIHSKNILHLDIKPANILMGFDLKWKYGDLGVSKVVSEEKQHTSNLRGYTAVYSSPEQYQIMTSCQSSAIVTKSSDIYSLGVVFLQLTGVDVYKNWIIKEKTQPGNFDKCLNPYYEEFNNRVIKKMMAYESNNRLEIEEILRILKELKDKKTSPVPLTPSPLPESHSASDGTAVIKRRKFSIQNIFNAADNALNNADKFDKAAEKADKEKEQPKNGSNQEIRVSSERPNDVGKLINIQKAKRKANIRCISISNLNKIFGEQNNNVNLNNNSGSRFQHVVQSERARKVSLHNSQQMEQIELQSSIQKIENQQQKLKAERRYKRIAKFPQVSPSIGSMENLAQQQLSTKDNSKHQQKYLSSLSDLDAIFQKNNSEKKSLSNLPSNEKIKLFDSQSKKETFYLPKIQSLQRLQPHLANNQEYYQVKKQTYNQFESQPKLLLSPGHYSSKQFGLPLPSFKDKYLKNTNNNSASIFVTPFLAQ